MVHSNPNQSRKGRKREEKSKVFKKEDNLTGLVQTVQAADICERALHRNVDSAQNNQKNTKCCRRSRKEVKDDQCDTKHMTCSSHLSRSDVGSKHSSSLRKPKRRRDSRKIDYTQLPSADQLMLSAEIESNSSASIVCNDPNNSCIPSMINLDASNYLDSTVPRMCKRKKCLNNEVQEYHSADTGCLLDSIAHEDKVDSCDSVIIKMGSLNKETNDPPVIPESYALDCSDFRIVEKRKRKIKHLKKVQGNHYADNGCLHDSIAHEDKDDSGDLVLKNTGSLDKEIDALHVLPKSNAANCSNIRIPGKLKRKIKPLKNEVQENHSTNIACSPGSLIHKDKVGSNISSFGKKIDALPVQPKSDASSSSDITIPGNPKRKIKQLKTEVQESYNTNTGCLPDIIISEDKDDSGYLGLKNVCSLDIEMDAPAVLLKNALKLTVRKKLLVLDLNGILCDVVVGSHGSHLPYKKVGMKSVFKRPFLDDFMAFCFERFAVGIWSSRNKWNIAGVVDYIMGNVKDKLVFCWDQTKCTLTGFNTVKDKYKPLVLKELNKLWNKEEPTLPWMKGDYSASNTLLVDDSPYKAICNPCQRTSLQWDVLLEIFSGCGCGDSVAPHFPPLLDLEKRTLKPNCAIFPFPYDFQDVSDNFLGPGGALRVYLESIFKADDVQVYVKEHSFGQRAITSEDEMWSFYKKILDKYNSVSLT